MRGYRRGKYNRQNPYGYNQRRNNYYDKYNNYDYYDKYNNYDKYNTYNNYDNYQKHDNFDTYNNHEDSNKYDDYKFKKDNSDFDISKLEIIETNEKVEGANENSFYGFDFEHSIVTKSLTNLNIHSINDRKIYTKENKIFFGLKLVIVKNGKYDKIPKFLDSGKFKVIPYSNKYYEINYPGYNKLYISINSKQLFIAQDENIKRKYYFFDKKSYYNYHKLTKTANGDKYEGYIHLEDKLNIN